jgi:acetyl esterase/lipase
MLFTSIKCHVVNVLLPAITLICLHTGVAEAEQPISKTTHVYKTVGDLEIKANLIRADDDVQRPVVVSVHGGALINGHRESVSGRMKTMLLDAGYAIVSIDYRLAPETKLPEIIKDVEDAFVWLRREGPKRLNLDTRKIAVMGGSAGGYLTLSTGYRVKPRPTVLVSFWGYGDLVGEWYSQPSPHPRHHNSKLTKEQAFSQVSGPPISDSRERKGNGGAFYQFCRQQGSWPKAVSTWDPHTEVDKYVPFMPVRNVTKDYPPTLMIHGTIDTDVPYEQSTMMAEQFKKYGVEHQLISIKGGEHGLGGGKKEEINAAYQAAFEFLNQHMMNEPATK